MQRIHDGLNQIVKSDNPLVFLIPLSGKWSGFYKIRFGPYRVRVEVDEENRTLIVHKLGARQNFYDN